MKRLFEMNIEELENLIADCKQEINNRKEKRIDELIQKFEDTLRAMEDTGVTIVIDINTEDAFQGNVILDIDKINYEY